MRLLKYITTALLCLLCLALVLFTLGVLWPLSPPGANPPAAALLLVNVNLVDVARGEVVPGTQILLEDGIISQVGGDIESSGIDRLDAGGRYAVPGLFDMHVHSLKMSPLLHHPLYIAAGVTAVRDMGGCLGSEDSWIACATDKREWDRAAGEGLAVSPRYDAITSLAINGGQEIPEGLDTALGAATAEGARARVQFDHARGIDFLKPYTRLPREGYFALAEAAAARDMYLAGHQPLAVSAEEAIAAGQRSIEHAFLFIWECYPGFDELRSSDNPRAVYTDDMRRRMLSEHDPALCSQLQEQLRTAGTAYVPTHTTRKLDAFALDPAYRSDPRLKYIPGPLQLLWRGDADSMARWAGADGMASFKEFYRFGITQTGVAHRAGVTVLAGTDAPDSFVFPGSGLHDELDHLVQAGLSPLAALRAATTEPARFLQLEGKAGIIAAGARADLVLVNRDPLQDIRALRDIDSVILAGAVYDREDLDDLLEGVEAAAGSWQMWPRFVWEALNSPIMRRQFAD